MLDLVLVNPGDKKQSYGKLGDNLAAIEPPLHIALLAAVLREKGFAVTIIDAEAESLDAAQTVSRLAADPPRIVGLGLIGANPSASSTPKMAAIRPLLEQIRETLPASRTVLFGIHPAALPGRTLQEEGCDFVIRGEAFDPLARLLETLTSGKNDFAIPGLWYRDNDQVIDNGWTRLTADLDDLPAPAWDLLPMEKYRAHNWHCFDDLDHRSPYGVIYTSLGCPFHCTYCNVHALYDGRPGIRYRHPQQVVADIDQLYRDYHVRHLKILDELFVTPHRRLFEICDLLAERNYDLNIWAYARVDTVSEKILQQLKQAGVNWLAFGIEAGSPGVRAGVSKGRFDQQAVRRAVAMTHAAGISVIGNFMFGLPDDDLETMTATLDLAQSLACEYVNFYTTMAYPGSPLYEEARQQGWELPDTWSGYAQLSPEAHPLPTKHLTAARVLRFRDEAFAAYYEDPSYLERIRAKFGDNAVAHIRQMMGIRLRRDLLESDPG